MTKKELILENITKMCDILNINQPKFGRLEVVFQNEKLIYINVSENIKID